MNVISLKYLETVVITVMPHTAFNIAKVNIKHRSAQPLISASVFLATLIYTCTNNAAFTPSTICYEYHDWQIAAERDTFLIFQVKIRDIASPCDQIRFGVLGHDWSISDDTICYDRINRSDKTPWVWVRSPRLGSPMWYDLIRADTVRCITTRSLRPGALCWGVNQVIRHQFLCTQTYTAFLKG